MSSDTQGREYIGRRSTHEQRQWKQIEAYAAELAADCGISLDEAKELVLQSRADYAAYLQA